jgi:hypothetical protein
MDGIRRSMYPGSNWALMSVTVEVMLFSAGATPGVHVRVSMFETITALFSGRTSFVLFSCGTDAGFCTFGMDDSLFSWRGAVFIFFFRCRRRERTSAKVGIFHTISGACVKPQMPKDRWKYSQHIERLAMSLNKPIKGAEEKVDALLATMLALQLTSQLTSQLNFLDGESND